MSLGEVDTLNLMVEKLENLFNESQDYYETFLDTNNLFKEGKLTDKEFFQKLMKTNLSMLFNFYLITIRLESLETNINGKDKD